MQPMSTESQYKIRAGASILLAALYVMALASSTLALPLASPSTLHNSTGCQPAGLYLSNGD